MRKTGKYWKLNLTVAALPIVSAIGFYFMDTQPRWTDWINCVPGGIGTGANGKLLGHVLHS